MSTSKEGTPSGLGDGARLPLSSNFADVGPSTELKVIIKAKRLGILLYNLDLLPTSKGLDYICGQSRLDPVDAEATPHMNAHYAER